MPSSDTIGSLVAVVSATAEQFGADMKSIQRSLDELKNKSIEVGEAVPKAFDIGVAVAGMEKGIQVAQQALERFIETFSKAREVTHLAEEIGSTPHELTGLQFAGMETGVDTESFNTSIGRMESIIGRAREGAEKASVAFKALGLDVNELAGMSAGGQLESIADAMKQVPANADRAALAVELFGKSGREMLPMLEEGAAGIEKLMQKGDALGATMGNEMAAKLAEGKRAIEELKATWEGFLRSAATDAGPLIKQGSGFLGNRIHEWTTWFKEMERLSPFTGGGIDTFLAGEREDKMEQLKAIGESLKRQQSEAQGENVVEKLKREQAEGKKAQEQLAKDQRETERQTEALNRAIEEDTEKMIKNAEKITEAARIPLEKFRDTLNELKSLTHEGIGGISEETANRMIEKAAEEFDKATAIKTRSFGESIRAGISGTDLFSSGGASMELAAGRAAQDMADHHAEIAEEQLAEAQRHTSILDEILRVVGRQIDFPVADHH